MVAVGVVAPTFWSAVALLACQVLLAVPVVAAVESLPIPRPPTTYVLVVVEFLAAVVVLVTRTLEDMEAQRLEAVVQLQVRVMPEMVDMA